MAESVQLAWRCWYSIRTTPPPLDAVVVYRGPSGKMDRLSVANTRAIRYKQWTYLTEWVMAEWRTKWLQEAGFTKWMLVAPPP